ncbi:hypothetical protein [Pseudoclavibacter helvolus]|uniref:hypothetical protein n=1 Tax=Pseudoclavibacter helvolus TaxID=255205 RepID=UPI003734D13E
MSERRRRDMVAAVDMAREGHRVLWLDQRSSGTHAAFLAAVDLAPDAYRVSHLNGGQRIEYGNGGWLRFQNAQSHALRTTHLDAVVIAAHTLETSMLLHLFECLRPSKLPAGLSRLRVTA